MEYYISSTKSRLLQEETRIKRLKTATIRIIREKWVTFAKQIG